MLGGWGSGGGSGGSWKMGNYDLSILYKILKLLIKVLFEKQQYFISRLHFLVNIYSSFYCTIDKPCMLFHVNS